MALTRNSWQAICRSAAILFVSLVAAPTYADDQHFITIGTAGVTGVYYPSGGATCQIVNRSRRDHGIRCSVETASGSISNINNIRSGNLDFGFVQSDWQHHAFLGTSVFEEAGPFKDLRSVFSLHNEVATVAVRAGSEFTEFNDLKGKKVNIGAQGSGSAATWADLIGSLGWTTENQKQLTTLQTSGLADALCMGRIDAYFVLIGHPAGLVNDTQEQCDIRLLGIDGEAVTSLQEQTPYYRPAEIPAGLYNLDEPISSFGVVATFVTSAKMPANIVTTLISSVFDHFDTFTQLHPALSDLTLGDLAAYDMPAPLHPGALKFFHEKGLLPQNRAK